MSYVVGADLPLRLFPPHSDDDISDRLHHRWTVLILAIMAIVVGVTEYVGDPIHCWCPAEFTDSHCNYTEAICWIKDTYYIPQTDYVPTDIHQREEKEIKYYQWVPIILLFLALCFKAPNLFWKMLNTKSGVNLEKMIALCDDCQFGSEREHHIEVVGHVIDRWLRASKRATYGILHVIIEKLSACCCFCLGRRTGTYLAGLYLGIKICYMLVSVGMLFLLNKFLAMDYWVYGAEVIDHLLTNKELRESPRFPRVTLCDFEIRQMQNIQRYTVQCVLSINLFNEKIFAFLWFWFVIMIFFGVYSYIMWLKNVILPSKRISYVHKYLCSIDRKLQKSHAEGKFTRDYLATDGVFALRMLEYNTNEMVVLDIMKFLWGKFGESVVV
ncbi:innexin unc-9-like isoform X2 [Haliotis rufescens]|uniref:innexin unc-9-like isoform X2 n=1 Tax=Haliotis rufescens TaxID=6454 RepID=UPI001EB08BEB|nr:innexin unc-9-like isoform X2 [Haliotis rufescens]